MTTHTIIVRVAGQAFQGNPTFNLIVNGTTLATDLEVDASFSDGEWEDITYTGDFDLIETNTLQIQFDNDLSGSGGDRNLFVDSITLDGTSYQAATSTGGNFLLAADNTTAAALWTDSSLTFQIDNSQNASASIGSLSLVGVNFSGAEFTSQEMSDWSLTETFPTQSEIDYYLDKGANVFRLPINWERLQPIENGPLDPTELKSIDDVVNYATSKGAKVIIDIHNYGAAYGLNIGESEDSDQAFANLWGQLAAHYADNSNVMFGLMNEPHVQTAAEWLTAVNDAIAAIRAAGATSQTILIPGVDWDTASQWITSGNAAVIGTGVIDPNNNYAFEVHQYFNGWDSGDYLYATTIYDGVNDIEAITQWAEQTGSKLFMGEFGVNSDSTSLEALNLMLQYMQQHSDVWIGGTYWEAGSSYNFYFSLDPSNGVDSPQMSVLENYLPGTSISNDSASSSNSDTIVLTVAGDSWEGDPQFIITVDGVQIGSVQTVTASEAAGQTQNIVLHGDFGTGQHTIVIEFLNDAYGGTSVTDRNLYVHEISYNGQIIAGSAGDNSTGSNSGSEAEIFTDGNVSFQITAGRAEDGYIAGATVFADSNGNGVLDNGEYHSTTGADGSFSLPSNSGTLILSGGVDASTHLAISGELKAPSGYTVISPISTIVTALLPTSYTPGQVSSAEQQVLASFGINLGISQSLATLDPVAGTLQGDPASQAVYIIGTEIEDTLTILSAVLGSTNSYDQLVNALAEQVRNGSVDLTNPETITQLILTAAPDFGTENAQQVATVVAAGNDVLKQDDQLGLSPDTLLRDASAVASVSQGQVVAAIENNITLDDLITNFTGDNLNQAIGLAESEVSPPCYCRGTLIATKTGEIPVEDLKIGDEIFTLYNKLQPIKWIGIRSYTRQFAARRPHITPICISAHTFAPNIPRRDLWVSPHHAIFFPYHGRGVLIEATDLLDGVQIFRPSIISSDIEYFHIELESHDVLLAEGALAETYLDDGNRLQFQNAFDDSAPTKGSVVNVQRYCAERHTEGNIIERIRDALVQRQQTNNNEIRSAA